MGFLAIDTETTGPDVHRGCKPFAVSMCDHTGKTYYWQWPVNPITREPQPLTSQINAIARTIQTRIRKRHSLVFHNTRFDVRALMLIGVDIFAMEPFINDTLLMSHVLDSGESHELKDLAVKYLKINDDDEKELKALVIRSRARGKRIGWTLGPDVGWDYWMPNAHDPKDLTLKKYSVLDAVRTARLYEVFGAALSGEQLVPHYMRELCLVPILYPMESMGIRIDIKTLRDETTKFATEAYTCERQCIRIAKAVGHFSLNIRSHVQLQQVLFNKMGLPIFAETKNGNPATDADTLEELARSLEDTSPQGISRGQNRSRSLGFVTNLLRYKKLHTGITSLRSYENLARVIPVPDEHHGSVIINHSLNQTGTRTTRFSHSNPNTANVSKQAEIPLRMVFGPLPKCIWYAIDYSQLELRIFAKAAGEVELSAMLAEGHDGHAATGELFLGKASSPADAARKRSIGKTLNFAIIYGAGRRRIADATGNPDAYDDYKKQFPNAAKFMAKTQRDARRIGCVRTLFGYRLFTPPGRAYAGVNYIVQGTAGDILKNAMIDCEQCIIDNNWTHHVRMVLTVHDELVFEVEKSLPNHRGVIGELALIMEAQGDPIDLFTPVDVNRVIKKWSEPTEYNPWHTEKGQENARHNR